MNTNNPNDIARDHMAKLRVRVDVEEQIESMIDNLWKLKRRIEFARGESVTEEMLRTLECYLHVWELDVFELKTPEQRKQDVEQDLLDRVMGDSERDDMIAKELERTMLDIAMGPNEVPSEAARDTLRNLTREWMRSVNKSRAES